MTSFFDGIRERLRKAGSYEQFSEVERDLVYPCLRASALPTFPTELIDLIDSAILHHGVDTLMSMGFTPNPDPEDDEQHLRKLLDLEEELHSIFHEAGRIGVSDQPQVWLDSFTLYKAQDRLFAKWSE